MNYWHQPVNSNRSDLNFVAAGSTPSSLSRVELNWAIESVEGNLLGKHIKLDWKSLARDVKRKKVLLFECLTFDVRWLYSIFWFQACHSKFETLLKSTFHLRSVFWSVNEMKWNSIELHFISFQFNSNDRLNFMFSQQSGN